MSASPDSLKSILYALFANLSIAVAKGFAAAFTGSSAMLAEAIHSLADSGNQLLLILGLRQARRPPSDEFPLGYGKSIYFWSFLVAIVLFSLGGLFSVYEGLHKLQHPRMLTAPWVAVAVLLFAIVAEGLSLWGCMREVEKERYGRTVWRWFRQSRSSELVVVFGEDMAALAGLTVALLAVLATMITGNPFYDALGTLVIGALLLTVAVFIAIEVKALLIGQSVEPRVLAEMRAFLERRPEIEEVFRLLTMQMGHDAMVATKVRMNSTGSERGMIVAINRVEEAFKNAFPMTAWLFFEPDVTDQD